MAEDAQPKDASQTGQKTGADLRDLKGQKKTKDPQTSKFNIPDEVKQKYPDLITLIMETESMNDDERQYWFQILPIMTDEQVEKLRSILQNEKEQLAKLDAQYQSELNKLDEKHSVEQQEKERKEERVKRVQAEKAAEEEEKAKEEGILKELDETKE